MFKYHDEHYGFYYQWRTDVGLRAMPGHGIRANIEHAADSVLIDAYNSALPLAIKHKLLGHTESWFLLVEELLKRELKARNLYDPTRMAAEIRPGQEVRESGRSA